uniref:DUF6451 domain-containing protein n=1 Tax=Octopus bimaculoides TaxID=37653 RepID=A0A0L8HA18_OCTBM
MNLKPCGWKGNFLPYSCAFTATLAPAFRKKKVVVMAGMRFIKEPITVEGAPVEDVSEFVYLGSKISKSGGSDEDITARGKNAWQAFAILRLVWKSTAVSTRTELRLFSLNVKSVLLYGSETWRATCSNYKKIQTFITKCLRQILHLKWFDRVPNTNLWERANQEPIHVQIRRRKWRWIGHTLRKEPSNVTRQALDWNPQGKGSKDARSRHGSGGFWTRSGPPA